MWVLAGCNASELHKLLYSGKIPGPISTKLPAIVEYVWLGRHDQEVLPLLSTLLRPLGTAVQGMVCKVTLRLQRWKS